MIIGGYIKQRTLFVLLASLSFSLFAFSFSFVSAQDAIQCTPQDINLTKNLRFPANNNIYLGTGYLNFSGGDNNIYAVNSGGNLLLKSPAQIIFESSAPSFVFRQGVATIAELNNTILDVNGDIEGTNIQGTNSVCIGGTSGNQCLTDWQNVCSSTGRGSCSRIDVTGAITGASASITGAISGGSISTSGNITAGGNISTAGGDVSGNRLCIGGTCYDSWATAVHGGLNTSYTGTGTGVFKIVAGSGISISPASGEGDVTISSKIIWCNGTCPVW